MDKGNQIDLDLYLKETSFFNFNHPEIQTFISSLDLEWDKNKAIQSLFYAVRDKFLYDPYQLDLTEKGLTSSEVLEKNRAWCVEKASLLISCARAIGVPARPGYAIVKNHIGVERLNTILKSELIVFHGYADLFLNNKWVKATPAFDSRVCKISGVEPLTFNTIDDCLFQAYSEDKEFMEYIHDYGTFKDIPIELMNSEMKKHYPHIFKKPIHTKLFKFNPHPSFLDPQN